MRLQVSPGIAFWYHISLLGIMLLPISIYYFLFEMLDIRKEKLLTAATVITVLLVIVNCRWGIILPPPEVNPLADGKFSYVYTTGWGTLFLLVIPEIALLVYVTVLAHFKIAGDKQLTAKLFPLLLGVLAIMIGNFMLFIPGVLFTFNSLGGVIMALCLVYIMYKQYLFEMSYRMTTGAIYSIALIIAMIPLWTIVSNLDNLVDGLNVRTKQLCILFMVLQSFWSVLTMLFARKQAGYIMKKRQSHMIEEQHRFQDETASLFSREELYKKLLIAINEVLKDSEVFIFLKGPEEENYEFVDIQAREVPTLTQKEQQSLIDIVHSPLIGDHPEIGLLKYDGQRQGFLYIRVPEKTKINYQEAAYIRQIAVCTAICLKNIKAYEAVYRMSIHDELTGLYNRNYSRDFFDADQKPNGARGLIYLDIDNFSLFNELYGERVGDKVLKWCASKICAIAGEEDCTFRIGSNEFMILKETDSREVLKGLVAKLQEEVTMPAPDKPKVMQPITFSVGISMYPKTASDMNELLVQAKRAVFYAKRNGKNRVEVYERGIDEEKEDTQTKGYEQIAPTVYALMAAIDAKDDYTFAHSGNVSEYAVQLAKKIGLKKNDIQIIKEAGLLHDIGKIGIPESILKKKGKLTDEEYQIMKTHVEKSIEMIHYLPNMSYVVPAVVSHHERYDGKGYPRGVQGEEIPLAGRILAVCDSFDAMTSKRVYKEALTVDYAVSELKKNRGTQFDPKLADAFIELVQEGEIVV